MPNAPTGPTAPTAITALTPTLTADPALNPTLSPHQLMQQPCTLWPLHHHHLSILSLTTSVLMDFITRRLMGKLLGNDTTATHAGIKQINKQVRASHRARPTMGMGLRTRWPRRPLSAYTWMRTDRGPQWSWLHRLGKATSPQCTLCDHHTQDGWHITFQCPSLSTQRNRCIGARTDDSWEALDLPLLIRSDRNPNEFEDGVLSFFLHIFNILL